MQLEDKQIIEAVGVSLEPWAKNCHAASLEFVRSEVAPDDARVARGFCSGVGGQHSWGVIGGPSHIAETVLGWLSNQVRG
ncbi:MAG: hypothetical protein OXH70_17670 [Acidobacteria bacterium]|nr:hypothetical protein [Acidobacteriota bacterium]